MDLQNIQEQNLEMVLILGVLESIAPHPLEHMSTAWGLHASKQQTLYRNTTQKQQSTMHIHQKTRHSNSLTLARVVHSPSKLKPISEGQVNLSHRSLFCLANHCATERDSGFWSIHLSEGTSFKSE